MKRSSALPNNACGSANEVNTGKIMYITIRGVFYDTHKRLNVNDRFNFAVKHAFEDLHGSICAMNQLR